MNHTCHCGGLMRPYSDSHTSFQWRCTKCATIVTQHKRLAAKPPAPKGPARTWAQIKADSDAIRGTCTVGICTKPATANQRCEAHRYFNNGD